jgi:hypothetical protein
MENFVPINYHRTRDFSEKMSATFEFVRQNFKGLAKSLLLIAGPPIVVAGLVRWSMFNDFSISASMLAGGDTELLKEYFFSVSFWMQALLMLVLFIVSSVTTIATINNYIILYGEKQSNQIQTNEVWERVRDTFWMYLGTIVLLTLLFFAAYIALVLFFVLLAAVSPFLIFIGVIVFIPALIYFVISCALVFIIKGYERIGFFEAVGRSIKLVQGKWWSTFGLIFVLYLVLFVLSIALSIPWYVITSIFSLHDTEAVVTGTLNASLGIFGLITFTVTYLLQSIMYSLPNIGIAFQYFNLVERKEARGLISQIESLGGSPSAQPPPAPDEHY